MQKAPDRLPPLDLLASFEAAARHLSFTHAGAERFITQSAMSRQIRTLEDDLGVALFRRHHRALSLTEHGLRLQATCTAVLAQLRSAVSDIRAPSQREVLALTTTPGLAALWLIPRLPAFTRAHPGIDVRLDASFERRNLRADGFDLAIRYARVDTAEGQPMFRETVQPVCSPQLLRRGGPPLKTPQDLRFHTLLFHGVLGAHGVAVGVIPVRPEAEEDPRRRRGSVRRGGRRCRDHVPPGVERRPHRECRAAPAGLGPAPLPPNGRSRRAVGPAAGFRFIAGRVTSI